MGEFLLLILGVSFKILARSIFMFLGVHRPLIENGKNPMKYIRFSVEDIERMLNEFFEGKTWSEPKR